MQLLEPSNAKAVASSTAWPRLIQDGSRAMLATSNALLSVAVVVQRVTRVVIDQCGRRDIDMLDIKQRCV